MYYVAEDFTDIHKPNINNPQPQNNNLWITLSVVSCGNRTHNTQSSRKRCGVVAAPLFHSYSNSFVRHVNKGEENFWTSFKYLLILLSIHETRDLYRRNAEIFFLITFRNGYTHLNGMFVF